MAGTRVPRLRSRQVLGRCVVLPATTGAPNLLVLGGDGREAALVLVAIHDDEDSRRRRTR